VKIEAPLHARLKLAAERTGLSKADIVRLSADIAVPRIEAQFAQMKGQGGVGEVGLGLRVDPKQLGEMKELYKSAVTDHVSGVEDLEGAEFVAAVEKILQSQASDDFEVKFSDAVETRIRRFLAVYAQLF
jgi:hypothetical protein